MNESGSVPQFDPALPAQNAAGPRGGDAETSYRERAQSFEAQALKLAARSRTFSNLRGLSFAAALIGALVGLFGGGGPLALSIAAVAFATFLALIGAHARVLRAESAARRRARVNLDALARTRHDWPALQSDGQHYATATHDYADDLDLFGPASLFQRLCSARTRYGQDALARMLKAPATPTIVGERQQAVRTLTPELDFRQELEAVALALVQSRSTWGQKAGSSAAVAPDPEPFLGWVESPPQLLERRWLGCAALVLPLLTVVAVTFASLGWVPALVWVLPVMLQVVVGLLVREATAETFAATTATQGHFVQYGAMLEMAEMMDFGDPLLERIRDRVGSQGVKASAIMKRFRSLVGWFELRHNGLIHPFANAFLLWDLHCSLALERWKRAAGPGVRQWFEALGELEALGCFAGLAFEEPTFAFPELSEAGPAFHASQLGHPLLAPRKRVHNDAHLAAEGSAVLVTGSNMSGKSTWLRSVGLAAVMAQAGAPVCARELRMRPVLVCTSIRIRDSLEGGVSHFYAEIAKLKRVVDAAQGRGRVLFLLDEILHGTNSRERQVGARWVLSELLRLGAVGLVSTHDLGLCELPPPLMRFVQQAHFREQAEGGRMTFDYRLRPGPVRAGNALELMRLVGLDVPTDEAPPRDASSDDA